MTLLTREERKSWGLFFKTEVNGVNFGVNSVKDVKALIKLDFN